MEDLDRSISIIIFADIVGYSFMMQTDERMALSKLQHFEDVIEAQTKKYDGEVVKAYGDGCLILFTSAVSAIKCAKSIQKKLRQEPEVPLRIGIHVGEIVRKNHDVFGDGVNIASRIESMGVPNSILMSADIYYQIKNRLEFKTMKLGDFSFKNIERDIPLYALSNRGLTVPEIAEMQGKGKVSVGTPTESSRNLKLILIPLIVLAIVALGYWIYQEKFGSNMDPKIPPKGLVFASKIEANGQAIDPGTSFFQNIKEINAVFRADMPLPGMAVNVESPIDGRYYSYLTVVDSTNISTFGWRWYLNGKQVNYYEIHAKPNQNHWLKYSDPSEGGIFSNNFGPGTYTIVILLDGHAALSSELTIEPSVEVSE